MSRTVPRDRPGLRDYARSLVLGLVLGGLWIVHRDEPVWEHAVRALVVLVVVPTVAAPLLGRWRRRAGAASRASRVSLRRFVAAKALLVVVGLGLDLLLTRWFPGAADLVVAAALVVAVVIAGTRYHHLLLVPAPAAAPAAVDS